MSRSSDLLCGSAQSCRVYAYHGQQLAAPWPLTHAAASSDYLRSRCGTSRQLTTTRLKGEPEIGVSFGRTMGQMSRVRLVELPYSRNRRCPDRRSDEGRRGLWSVPSAPGRLHLAPMCVQP